MAGADAPNAAPIIQSQAPTVARAGQPFTYQVEATDPEGTILSYLLAQAPPEMTLDPETGLVAWNPTTTSPDQADIVLHVYDFNPRGIRAYEKVGFREEGHLREYQFADGRHVDVVVMGLLADELLESDR